MKRRLWRWLVDGPVAWGARRLSLWRTIAGGSEPDAKVFGVCFLLLLPLYCAPLFVTEILPGLDLPLHLALADMLGKRGSPA
ncbi:MAG TPA: hypothetical protein VJ801_08305, partial [Polyangia bacterium]|nr:hypothetical protein [Polyangia bacterium]